MAGPLGPAMALPFCPLSLPFFHTHCLPFCLSLSISQSLSLTLSLSHPLSLALSLWQRIQGLGPLLTCAPGRHWYFH